MSKTLNLERINEHLNSRQFGIERTFNGLQKYILIRHLNKGYQAIISVSSKYTIQLDDSTIQLDQMDNRKVSFSDYGEMTDTDTMYNKTLDLSDTNTEMVEHLQRYKQCLKGNPTYGLFFWEQGFISVVWSDHVYNYRCSLNPDSLVQILPVISVDNLLSWSSRIEENLETMVDKFHQLLSDVDAKYSEQMVGVVDSINKIQKLKQDCDKKITAYETELIRTKELIREYNDEITSITSEIGDNSGLTTGEVFRKSKFQERLDEMVKKRTQLFRARQDLQARLSTQYYIVDNVLFMSRESMNNLEKALKHADTNIIATRQKGR